MKIWDFKPSGDLFTTVAVGAAVAAAPVVIPFAWSAVRPLLKTVLKGGFMLYETGRGAYTAVAQWTGPEEAAITPAKEPVKTKARIRPTGREDRALAQNLGLVEEQSLRAKTGKEAAIKKPKPLVKTAAKKSEKRK
jgi:hypothetical protein